jgi:hypothetical protein
MGHPAPCRDDDPCTFVADRQRLAEAIGNASKPLWGTMPLTTGRSSEPAATSELTSTEPNMTRRSAGFIGAASMRTVTSPADGARTSFCSRESSNKPSAEIVDLSSMRCMLSAIIGAFPSSASQRLFAKTLRLCVRLHRSQPPGGGPKGPIKQSG